MKISTQSHVNNLQNKIKKIFGIAIVIRPATELG